MRTPVTNWSPSTSSTAAFQANEIFGFASARSCMIFDARSLSRRWITVTCVAKPTRPPGGSGVLAPRPTWEYTILALGNSLERQMEQLTRMGALGCELVNIIAPGPPHGGLSLAYLKRPMNG